MWATAFFVGYSIDSFVDIFVQRFGQTISTRVDGAERASGGKPRDKKDGKKFATA